MKPHSLLLILLLATLALRAEATPPEPPEGKRWILNETFSDEFAGTKLDDSKWTNIHPTWKGRPPGLFVASQVTVADGLLSIQGKKLDQEVVTTNWNGTTSRYTIAGGAVVSKSQDAFFGYYECRFKAAKTTMSTTFWLSTRHNFDGPADGNDRYGLELDIQECIGRSGDFKGSHFAYGMHSNSHFWYTDSDGEKHDLRAPQVKFDSETLASDGFNTYGGWWRDENTVSFYFNNSECKTVRFNDSIKPHPFDQPMGLNLVSETYPFPWIELPHDDELADPEKNTCQYDWVRAYTLVDIDAPSNKETPIQDPPVSAPPQTTKKKPAMN